MNIYHRIYKLHQRKIPAQQIAATTHMPLQSVREIIKKLEGKDKVSRKEVAPELEPYLDFHITKHNKYTLLDYSGFFMEEFMNTVKTSLSEIRQQLGQTVAIKMDEVVQADEITLNLIVTFSHELSHLAKTVVILSPSDAVEELIIENNIENHLKVFGTLRAFEEHAFNISHGK